LDLLRFTAAMAVVFRHYAYRGYAAGIIPQHFSGLEVIAKYGYLGVELFFMISGFVIVMSMQGRSAWEFAVARIARLYPAFWTCCTLTAVVIAVANHPEYTVGLHQFVLNLTMVGGFLGQEYVDGVYWTLEVEITFYLWVFVILCFGVGSRVVWLLAAWLGISALHAVYEVRYVIQLTCIPQWAPYFVAGSICFLVRRDGWSPAKVILIVASLPLAFYYTGQRIVEMETQYVTALSRPVVYGLIALLFVIFLLVATNKFGWLNRRCMLGLGVLTYPLYLLHERIGFIILWLVGGRIEKHLLLALVIALMLLLSWLVHVCAERRLGPTLRRILLGRVDGKVAPAG
jgi:peptidoglycan/LPS O-acetylase OafA/YrhL